MVNHHRPVPVAGPDLGDAMNYHEDDDATVWVAILVVTAFLAALVAAVKFSVWAWRAM